MHGFAAHTAVTPASHLLPFHERAPAAHFPPPPCSLYPLLREVKLGIDPYKVFEDADWALLIGAKPRGPGMERKCVAPPPRRQPAGGCWCLDLPLVLQAARSAAACSLC